MAEAARPDLLTLANKCAPRPQPRHNPSSVWGSPLLTLPGAGACCCWRLLLLPARRYATDKGTQGANRIVDETSCAAHNYVGARPPPTASPCLSPLPPSRCC